MSSHKELAEEIERFRKKAARFYRTDFHLHSPFSCDWMNDLGDSLLDRNTQLPINQDAVKVFYQACKDRGLELATITDHMRYSFGVQCAIFSRNVTASNKVTVLPGIELSIKISVPTISDYRIHVIGVFPEHASGTIERIFEGQTVPAEDERKGNECLSFENLKTIVEMIHKNGGIAIAAHIYGPNGARLMYTSKAKLILESLKQDETDAYSKMYAKVGDELKESLYVFDALQVRATTDPIHFSDADGNLYIALVLGSDTHKPSLIGKEKSLTWVKMEEPSFEGLTKALQFPDTRIRFRANLPDSKPPRLLGIRITGAENNEYAFFKKLLLGFSDNLTVIVGPRGSGKSAIIDALRYTFGYNRTLNEIQKLRDQIVERQNHTLIESRIEVIYELKNNSIRILRATFDPKEEYTTKVYDLEGNEVAIEDVEKCGDFPLNLYGWNELEILGEQPDSQRENLDKFIPEVRGLKEERSRLYEQLAKNREDCLSRVGTLGAYFVEAKDKVSILRLPEYEAEFNSLNTPEMEQKFGLLDDLTAKIRYVESLERTIKESKDYLSAFAVPNATLSKGITSPELSKWVEDFLNDELKWQDFRGKFLESKNLLDAEIQTVLDRITEKLTGLRGEKRELEKQMAKVLGTASSISADLRNNAKARLDNAKAELERYNKAYKSFEEEILNRSSIVAKLKEINQRIFATRDAHKSTIVQHISVVQDLNFKIDLELNQGNDRTYMISYLTNSPHKLDYAGRQYKSQEWPAVIASKHNPLTLAESLFAGEEKAFIAGIIQKGYGGVEKKHDIDDQSSTLLVKANNPYEKIGDPAIVKVDRERLQKILRIQELQFEDEFFIKLNGKPIQHCSPGQRCSAMLPIVTLTSEAPIVIDQPEDNLDNRLVSRAIFKILSKLKESRQIIVATHNPNIPVSGDAEQVLVLRADGTLDTFGSIDDDEVVQNIIYLLEGGKDAFNRRRRRYSKYLN